MSLVHNMLNNFFLFVDEYLNAFHKKTDMRLSRCGYIILANIIIDIIDCNAFDRYLKKSNKKKNEWSFSFNSNISCELFYLFTNENRMTFFFSVWLIFIYIGRAQIFDQLCVIDSGQIRVK